MAESGWALSVRNPARKRLPHYESLFTVANGRLGLRGATPHPHGSRSPGTYLAGLYDALPGQVAELVNLPDPTWVRLFLDGHELGTRPGEASISRMTLNLRDGLFTASAGYRDASGHLLRVEVERFASLVERDLVHLRVTVTPENCAGEIGIATGLRLAENPPRLQMVNSFAGGEIGMVLETRGKRAVVAACEAIITGVRARRTSAAGDDRVEETMTWQGTPGVSLTFDHCLVFMAPPVGTPADEAWASARAALARASSRPYEEHRAINAEAWHQHWAKADVEIVGDPEAQLGVRYAVFQLIGAAPERPGCSIAAKGLSGPGYRGHVFWDTELFMLPFFTYVLPEKARDILAYRHHTLAGARAKARDKGFPGAMFAWESADTGEETTPATIVHPQTGRIQRVWSGERELHITADIVHAIDRFGQVTGDDRFMVHYGAEVILEGARFWSARLEPGDDGFLHVSGVIGPDEHHEFVDDNTFTNAMARHALRVAAVLAQSLARTDPARWRELRERLGLAETEPEVWAARAERVYLPPPGPHLVVEQYRGFSALRSPEAIKQPDILMLAVTLPGLFSRDILKANWDYYEPLTDHGSSLSPSIHALVAQELGLYDKAAAYFRRALRIDREDAMGNGADGLHLANLGGIWQDVALGFAGIGWRDGVLCCEPHLPSGWRAIRCSVCCRGSRLRFAVTPDSVTVRPVERLDCPFPLRVSGRAYVLTQDGLRVTLTDRKPTPGLSTKERNDRRSGEP